MHFSIDNDHYIRFISDLHLTSEKKKLSVFFNFLDNLCEDCQGLFILGDLFDVWLGKDAHQSEYQTLQEKLKKVTCPIFFIPGNRDFLIESDWLANADIVLLNDPTVIYVNQIPILLTHGDQLCTFDRTYMFYRRIVNMKWLQNCFRYLPLSFKKKIFKSIRNNKPQHQSLKRFCINTNHVNRMLKVNEANIMIHGHIHKLGTHIYGKIKRFVLDEWMPACSTKFSYADLYCVRKDQDQHLLTMTHFCQ